MSSIPLWVIGLVSAHLELVLGYCICVLFPIPWLNAKIISLWSKLLKRNQPTAPGT